MDRPNVFRIRLRGRIDPAWFIDVEGFAVIVRPDGTTEIRGVPDEAALHGLLLRARDLGLGLVSVELEPEDQAERTHRS